MKQLSLREYMDKVHGCFTGKNIGGVLGGPFEAVRQVNDVTFYTQDLSMGPPPNDDLDLQIIWLAAAERYGRHVNASILGEYWLSYCIPNWVEYGTGKRNLRAGIQPPMSGMVDNVYKDSNGCFIRSEIWACLCPGHPDLAAFYAHEDGMVDHEGEGMLGEVFFAAVQSAAFVESDKRKLIDIGLSYIPEDCMLRKCILKAIECYDGGVSFLDARKEIHNLAPGTFGIQNNWYADTKVEGNEGMEIGAPGYDCPENIGFTIAAWLYGEDDFGKSICMAVNCGEDTDCTCATLAATIGIIRGESGLPEKWKAPLNDKISTMCIDKTSQGIWTPDNAKELAERIAKVMPQFLGLDYCNILSEGGMTVDCLDGKDLYQADFNRDVPFINGNGKTEDLFLRETWGYDPYRVHAEFPAFHILADYEGSICFTADQPKKLKITVINSHFMREQQWAKITLYLPEGAYVKGGSAVELPLNNTNKAKAEAEFEICTENFSGARLEGIADVSLNGRHSNGQIRITLFRKY